MSSTAYWAVLPPDIALRRLVIAGGVALLCAGLLLLAFLDVPLALRIAIAVLWGGMTAWRIVQLALAYRRHGTLRIGSGGAVEISRHDAGRVVGSAADANGNAKTVSGQLSHGSIVLRRLAWLRVVPAEGQPYVELLRGDDKAGERSDDWRRLQVICRHLAA